MDRIKIIKNNDKQFEKELGLNLHRFNKENCKYIDEHSDNKHNNKIVINFAVYDKDELIGGASGWIQYQWYFLDQLWINEKYRKHKIGNKVIKEIENVAKENKCIGIRTETWSFQARGFYEKNGFEVYAELNDCPPGVIEYFLKKYLSNI